MSLVLLAISLSIALGVLAFRFAVFALPVMAGIAAFLQVHEGGAGFGLSFLAGLAGAALSVMFVIAILGFARNPFLRLGALGLFAVPAAVAGYALAHGVAKHAPCPSPLKLGHYIGRERGIWHGEETAFRRRRAEAAA
ncbi:MAG: hypothetical protein AAGB10_14360 [Pseudomonadota bacterium]